MKIQKKNKTNIANSTQNLYINIHNISLTKTSLNRKPKKQTKTVPNFTYNYRIYKSDIYCVYTGKYKLF